MPYKDPEKRKAAFKKYYEKNKEKVLEKNRKWAADNPDKAREINTKSHRKLRAEGVKPIEIDPVEHEDINEALDTLIDIPKLHPEPLPKQKIDEAEVDQMLNDLKEGLK